MFAAVLFLITKQQVVLLPYMAVYRLKEKHPDTCDGRFLQSKSRQQTLSLINMV